jgi:hypothetical protein
MISEKKTYRDVLIEELDSEEYDTKPKRRWLFGKR